MQGQKPHILVIEDDKTDRLIMKRTLADTGISHELTFAVNIEEGLNATKDKEFDCIFLDYKLPDGTGLDMLKAIRSTSNASPIYMVTSQEDVSTAIEAMELGANYYIIKDKISRESISQLMRWAFNSMEQVRLRRELEHKLNETQQQLITVASNAPVVLFTLNLTGQFLFVEGKGLSSIGINKNEIVNQNINSLADLPITPEHFERALKGDEFTIVKEWRNFYFEIFYSPVTTEQTITGVLGVVSDVTNHKLAEKNLEQARILAEETARIKEQFLANMSHEIRTPMNGIIGLTRILLNTKLSEEQNRYLQSIRNCSDNLLVIINDILDFSKIEAGKMNFETVAFSIEDVSSQTIELFQPKADEKSLQLVLEKDSTIPSRIYGDPTRLSQILNNLVSNAIKFTEKGEIRILLRLTEKNQEVVKIQFEVRDTGIGIPEKILPSIFDSFTQASSDTTRKFGGTGLGLTIVKRLVELQNGSISVRSRINGGTSFTFDLPFILTKKDTDESSDPLQNVNISHLKILIAEDNKVNQLVAKKVFDGWGNKVEIADNGAIALEKYRSTDFDLIVMDIQMPEMDGYTAVRIIRNDFPANKNQVPILAMTAHATESERQKILDSGMNDYINKPFNPDDLKKKIIELTKSVQPTLNSNIEPINTTAKLDLRDISENAGTENGNVPYSEEGSFSNGHYPRINLSYLKRISDGNDTFVIEMIEMFLNKTPLAIDQMKECFKENKWEELGKIAHRIKPSFAYVGLQDLQTTLTKIESCAENKGDKKAVNELLNQVQNNTNNAFEQLRKELISMK